MYALDGKDKRNMQKRKWFSVLVTTSLVVNETMFQTCVFTSGAIAMVTGVIHSFSKVIDVVPFIEHFPRTNNHIVSHYCQKSFEFPTLTVWMYPNASTSFCLCKTGDFTVIKIDGIKVSWRSTVGSSHIRKTRRGFRARGDA